MKNVSYLSYQLAKMLQRLHFDEPTAACWEEDSEDQPELTFRKARIDSVLSPNDAHAVDWLRRCCGYLIYIVPAYNIDGMPAGYHGRLDDPASGRSEYYYHTDYDHVRRTLLKRGMAWKHAELYGSSENKKKH